MSRSSSAGDISGFFTREYGKLKKYTASRLSWISEEEPEEIVHDVLTRLLDRPDLTIPLGELAAYVYGSIRNRIIDRWRRGIHRGDQNGDCLEQTADDRYDFIADLEESDQSELLDEALGTLTGEERAIIEATEFDGFTYRELEEMWSVPAGTLMSRKKRALDKMRVWCKEALNEE
jgi:RNA polymerase sigma-70 factor (ECF subfamily)